jgi:hypothetical protein
MKSIKQVNKSLHPQMNHKKKEIKENSEKEQYEHSSNKPSKQKIIRMLNKLKKQLLIRIKFRG